VIPDQTENELDEALQKASPMRHRTGLHMFRHGILRGWIDMVTYRRAEATGKLPIRIYSFVAIRSWQNWIHL
jgi:hypothetical protein